MILPWMKHTKRTYTVRLMLVRCWCMMKERKKVMTFFTWEFHLPKKIVLDTLNSSNLFYFSASRDDTSLGPSSIRQEERIQKNGRTIYYYIKFHFIRQQKLCWMPLNQFQLSHSSRYYIDCHSEQSITMKIYCFFYAFERIDVCECFSIWICMLKIAEKEQQKLTEWTYTQSWNGDKIFLLLSYPLIHIVNWNKI